MNPHKNYALLVGIGTAAALGLMLAGGGFVAVLWFFPALPIILIRWARLSFRRLAAKKAEATAESDTPNPKA